MNSLDNGEALFVGGGCSKAVSLAGSDGVKATANGLLQPIGADPIKFRTSLEADDAALFLRPFEHDLTTCSRFFNVLARHWSVHKHEKI